MVFFEEERGAEQRKQVHLPFCLLVQKLNSPLTRYNACASVNFFALLAAVLGGQLVQSGQLRLQAVILCE